MNNDKLLAGLRELADNIDIATSGPATLWPSVEQPAPTTDDLAEAARSVATQQRDLVDRLRVDPADLRQEVRQAAGGDTDAAILAKLLWRRLCEHQQNAQPLVSFSPLVVEELLAAIRELFTLRAQVATLTEQLDNAERRTRELEAQLSDQVRLMYDAATRAAADCPLNEEGRVDAAAWAQAAMELNARVARIIQLEEQVATLESHTKLQAEALDREKRCRQDAERWLRDAKQERVEFEAKRVESEQALTVANASWTEAVRQRDARIVELNAQLAECAGYVRKGTLNEVQTVYLNDPVHHRFATWLHREIDCIRIPAAEGKSDG
jgi:hypothetical protein